MGRTTRAAVYHTPTDTVDAVSENALRASIGLASALARSIDAELE